MSHNQDYLESYDLMMDAGPHYPSPYTSSGIMKDVLIALLFPTAAALYYFPAPRVALMIIVGVTTAIFFEWGYQKIRRLPVKIHDGSAAVTGYLAALSLPVSAPIWTLVLGTAFAIIIVKQLSGGIGRNRLNPAATARTLQKVFLSPWITNWVLPGPDAISTATPLESIGHFSRSLPEEGINLWHLFLGQNLGGPMGETSKLALLIAFIFLTYRHVINPRIPLIYLATIGLWAFLWSGFNVQYALAHLLSGTVVFGAIFMVTDYSSTPITLLGHEVFAFCAATLCFLLRIVFNLPGGFGISLVAMNALSPLFDYYFAPRTYGHHNAPRVKVARELPLNSDN